MHIIKIVYESIPWAKKIEKVFMMDTTSKCLWNFIKHVGNISGYFRYY